jgi:hypothetical protein
MIPATYFSCEPPGEFMAASGSRVRIYTTIGPSWSSVFFAPTCSTRRRQLEPR